MENELSLDDLYEQLAELEGIAWREDYDPLHPFNHKWETRRLNRIDFIEEQIKNMKNKHGG